MGACDQFARPIPRNSKLLTEFPHLRKQFWGRHLWARGYFCCSSGGNVTDEVIAAYLEHPSHDTEADFRIEGEGAPSGEPPSA